MAGLGLSIKLLGAEKLIKALGSNTIKEPLGKGIKAISLKMEGLTKKATVIDMGRLSTSIFKEVGQNMGRVGTNVEYAPFVEYGTQKMEARHREGGLKVLGMGMFTFALGKLKEWLGQGEKDIAKDIEARFD